jgi:hypothetical protein
MDKFWNWMIEKGYAKIHDASLTDEFWKYTLINRNDKFIGPEPEMLIGYKIKFIYEIGCRTWLKPCDSVEELSDLLDEIIENSK